MKKIIGIYAILNKINLDIYIGSSLNVIGRISSHINCLKFNKHYNIKLQRAWNKYGECNFEIVIIQRVREKYKLICKEQQWIDYYESYADYNILCEADSLLGMEITRKTRRRISKALTGKIIPIEVRKKISNKLKGRKLSKETRLNISRSRLGVKRPNSVKNKISNSLKGHKVSDETKSKISNSKLGMVVSEETRLKISKGMKGKIPWNKGKKWFKWHKNV